MDSSDMLGGAHWQQAASGESFDTGLDIPDPFTLG